MSADPSTLLAPLKSAFPKYAGLLMAVGELIAQDPPPPAPGPLPDLTLTAGRFVHLDGNGSIISVDFGQPAAAYNLLRGYNAAHVYDTPGDFAVTIRRDSQPDAVQHVHVVPDTRPTITLTAGSDLAAALATLKDDTILLLPAGATFDLHQPATVAANGVSLRAIGGGPAPRIRRIATPGSYSALIASGSNVSIEGIEFDSDHPYAGAGDKVGVYAIKFQGTNLLVRDCTFRNIDDGLHCDPLANGLVVVDCGFTNELRACAVYTDAMKNVVLLGLKAQGSVVEHIVRLEGAHNVLVHGSDLANRNGKETIAIRIGDCVAVMQNTLRQWARISEGEQAARNIYCPKVLFAGNHFAGLRPGGPWLQINPGAQDVWIDANSFDVDAQQSCVAIQAPISGPPDK